nr:ATP-binding cassette domain-containing protein [Pseudopedobacter sp.]
MSTGTSYQKYHQPQLYHHDCGLASLKMVCNFYQITFDYQNLLYQYLGLKGINILTLQSIAEDLGLELKAYAMTTNGLKDLSYPCIFIQNNTQNYHAVTCFNFDSKHQSLIIGDPKRSQVIASSYHETINYQYVLTLTKLKYTRQQKKLFQFKNPFLLFLKTIAPGHQSTYLRFLFLSLMAGAFTLGITVFIQRMIDAVQSPSHVFNAISILCLMLLLFFIKCTLAYFFKLIWIAYQKDISIHLYDKLFNHLANLPSKTIYSLNEGDYLAAINDLNYSITAHQLILQFFLSDFLMLLFYLFICGYYSIPILLIVLCASVLPIYFIIRKGPQLLMLFENNRLANVQALNSFLAHVKNLRFSPGNEVNHQLLFRTKLKFNDFYQDKYQTLLQAQNFTFILNSFMALSSGILVYFLFKNLQEQTLSIGAFSSLFSIIFILLQMLNHSFKLPLTLHEYLPSVIRCHAQLSSKKPAPILFKIPDFKLIKIENYSIQHPQASAKLLVSNFNLSIEKHSLTVITGENGKGKSFLLHTLLGHSKTTNGSIYIDDTNVPYLPKDGFTAFMPQKAEVWDGSLAFNITMELNPASAVLLHFCELLNLMSFVNEFPNGLDTFLGADGYQLSQGQSTLVSFMRALYSKPQLLILDEPTSFLSANLFDFLIDLLLLLKTKTTLLIVSHEPKILALSDQVYNI